MSKAKPVCWIRMKNGEPDWGEDCVSSDYDSLAAYLEDGEGYSVIPLYRRPAPRKRRVAPSGEDKQEGE